MIYTHYSGLLIDERAKTTWIGWLNIQLDALRFGPNAAAKMHANEIRGRSLTRKQVRDKAPDIFMKAQDFIRYSTAFEALFKKYGQWTKRDPYRSAVMLASFDRFQWEVYDQERKYEYAWVIHDKASSSYSSKDGEYFKEDRKTSLYSKKSKSRWCPISPYQSLPIVSIADTKQEGM